MNNFIFIAGAPGSGKSVVAAELHKELKSPIFEFGWIPEFRNKGDSEVEYIEEEELAFENLTLVVKNYAKHGFTNVIITDLNNKFVEQIPTIFNDYSFSIFTLRINDEEMLKSRVLDETRSSGYRDWEEAIAINRELLGRAPYTNETLIDVEDQEPNDLANQILEHLDHEKF